jgi:hypothetical protein
MRGARGGGPGLNSQYVSWYLTVIVNRPQSYNHQMVAKRTVL